MMSEKLTQADYECSNPECGSSEFMELRTAARLAVDSGQEEYNFYLELPECQQDTWGFVCVACGTVADARLWQALLERLD